jgi:hypothetical protein
MRVAITNVYDPNHSNSQPGNRVIYFHEVTQQNLPDLAQLIAVNKPEGLVIHFDDVAKSIPNSKLSALFDCIERISELKWFNLGLYPVSNENYSLFLKQRIFSKYMYPYLAGLTDNTHVNFLVASEARTAKILSNRDTSTALKKIIPTHQSFRHSSTAYSLMEIMYRNTPDFNMHTELAIYSSIWERPGDIADPTKIKSVAEQNGYTVDLIIVPELANKYLGANSELSKKFNHFKNNFFTQKHIHEQGVNNDLFQPGTNLLILVRGGDHTINAMRSMTGEVILHEPWNANERRFKTIEDFLQSSNESIQPVNENPQKLQPSLARDYTGINLLLKRQISHPW